MVSYTIFMCLCIDMIVLPLLIGMNFIEYGSSKYLPIFTMGKHTDFGAEWYGDVGY